MIGCIIQARMGSTRLPGKVMFKVDQEPILFHVYNRVVKSKLIQKTIIATTKNPEDDIIEQECKDNLIECFRGSERDVLDRYKRAADKFGFTTVVRITADCPMIDPDIIDEVIEKHLQNNGDYTSNAIKDTYPDGLDVSVFSYKALSEAWLMAVRDYEREHIGEYILNNREKYRVFEVTSPADYSGMRWTIDQEEDYQFYKEIYDLLPTDYRMTDVLNVLQERPDLLKINAGIERNEGLRISKGKEVGN